MPQQVKTAFKMYWESQNVILHLAISWILFDTHLISKFNGKFLNFDNDQEIARNKELLQAALEKKESLSVVGKIYNSSFQC